MATIAAKCNSRSAAPLKSSLWKADVSRVQEVIQLAAIARLCCDIVLQRSNYGPPSLSEKILHSLPCSNNAMQLDHLLQLIGIFIMGDKRQWQDDWVRVKGTNSFCVRIHCRTYSLTRDSDIQSATLATFGSLITLNGLLNVIVKNSGVKARGKALYRFEL